MDLYYTAVDRQHIRRYVRVRDRLLPPSLREWSPRDHLAFFVSDLVNQASRRTRTTRTDCSRRSWRWSGDQATPSRVLGHGAYFVGRRFGNDRRHKGRRVHLTG